MSLLQCRNLEFDNGESRRWAQIDTEIKDLFLQGQCSGEFRPDLTATWLTDAFYNLLGAAGWSIRTGRAAPRDFITMVTELLLNGARNR